MKFTFRGFALTMAAVLVATLPMTALAQKDDKKRSKQEKEEIETIVKMVDAAMAGQPAPSDVQLKIAPVFLKSQEARNFVPFSIELTGLPQKDSVLYIRVVDPTVKVDPKKKADIPGMTCTSCPPPSWPARRRVSTACSWPSPGPTTST